MSTSDISGNGDCLFSEQEFEVIFKEHYANLCSYAYSFMQEQEASEEVVQETFFKLWTNRNTLNIDTSVKAYLYRAVRNASLNVIKHIGIREEYKRYNQEDINLNEQQDSDMADMGELEVVVRRAIEMLPEQRKKVFIMSRYQGLKYREIADSLNISVKTVEGQMSKALIFLRKELSEYLPLILIYLLIGQ